ncbi:hypothetical protein [Fibrella forsythiae]|uniref:Uncharacterized protein n=1 Tax=Fibrella forsythiae TaxID=2817061 RepID=A0ABS3JBG2_9BACT|nr:hypothetical protein [Fibrella forsythiae]MBO0947330.1 hypothetical protein [Fibrella forsythiae]
MEEQPKTYRVIVNPKGGYSDEKVRISEEGALLIWAAYTKLFGRAQTMERRESRGGICYTSEINQWKKDGQLPADFDYTAYIVDEPSAPTP